MAVHTFRERWTLFVGTLLCVTLGVALVESSLLILLPAAGLDISQRDAAKDVQGLVGLTLLVSSFLSVFIIGSTFTFTVNERRRDLSLLRLAGATRRQLRLLLAGESIVVGTVGGVSGIVLGLGIVPVQLILLGRLGIPTDLLDVHLSLLSAALAGGSGLVLSLLGVCLASRRAARMRPLDALGDVDDAARVMTSGRWTWGLFSAALTIGGLIFTQASSDPLVAILSTFFLIFSASVALQQLSPLVVPIVARLGAVLARRGVEGAIAYANLVDGRRRTATIAGPLITLVGIGMGLYGVTLSQSAAQVRDLELTTRADLVVTIRGVDTSGIVAMDGVAAVAPIAEITGRATFQGADSQMSEPVDLLVTDPAAYREVMTPRLRAGALTAFDDASIIANGHTDGPFPFEVDALRIRTGARAVTLDVVARTATSLTDDSAAVVPIDQVDPAVLVNAATRAMITVDAGADVTVVRESLIAAGYDATTTAEWAAGDQAALAGLNRNLTLALAGLGGLYALISVVNAVALAAASRKREFAIARLAGMTRTQVIRIGVLEALGVGVIGIALGSVAALTGLLAVSRGFALLLGEPIVVVPWVAIGGLAAVSLTAVSLTAGVGTLHATRASPITLAAARE